MTKSIEATAAPIPQPRPPDGTLTMRIDNQTFIMEVFFNHDSKETFGDKLLRVILAESMKEPQEAESVDLRMKIRKASTDIWYSLFVRCKCS
jgi:hypothetical protein